MWYIWYYSDFNHRYIRVPGQRPYSSAAAAQRVVAKARGLVDYSYIVLPY